MEHLTGTLGETDLRLLERLGAGLAIVDPADRVVLWSEEAARLLRIPAREAVGRDWSECVTLVREGETGDATARVEASQPGGWHGQVKVRTRDGRELWLRAHIQDIQLEGFDLPCMAALFWEGSDAIAGTKAGARHSRETEARERLVGSARIGGVVVEQMADAIITTDPDRRVTALNPAGERLYGVSEEAIVGLPIDQVLEQLKLDGSPLGLDTRAQVIETGYWHGRVVQRPLMGTRTGENLLVDLSVTALRDDRGVFAGLIGMIREVRASASLESEAAALGSLAVATGCARTRREVAEASLERLCEATMADVGIIATWDKSGAPSAIEASRGLSPEVVEVIRAADVPELGAALDEPGAIVSIDSLPAYLRRTELGSVIAREGLARGLVVDLRARDTSIGFMALAARNPVWARPSDAVILQAAAQVVGAMENARLMERLEHGLEQEKWLTAQLEALMNLTLLPQGEIDEATVALFLLDRVISSLGATGGFVVRTAGKDRFRVVAALRIEPLMLSQLTERRREEFPFWRRFAGPEPRAYLRTLEDDEVSPRDRQMLARGVISYAAFPIGDGTQAFGAFVCYFSGAPEKEPAVDDRTIDAVGRIVSIAYANVRMSEGLNEAAEHERRLTAELRALQELTLLGAATDDLNRLAQETIEAVVVSTGASGGGYVLVDTAAGRLDPVVLVGQSSRSLGADGETLPVPPDWPPLDRLQSESGVWLSASDGDGDTGGSSRRAQAILPLRVDGKLAAALDLEWSEEPGAEQYDARFLEPIARICSIGLANFRLRAELLHRAAAAKALGHRLATLDELTRIGEEASSFEELAHRTVGLVREALGAAGVCYLLLGPGRHFETHAVAGETGAFRQWIKGVPAKDAPGGSILLTGGNSVLANFATGEVNERVLPLARATGLRSFGAIPIRTGEELAGALLCFFEQPAAALPVGEDSLDSVARIGGIALANFRLRERLVSSEERYRTLFEESPDALFVSALDGTVLDANEAAVRLYRVNRGEVLGRYFGQFIFADEREMARRRQIVWAQGRGTFEDRGRRPDGTEFKIEIEVRVVELGDQRRFLSLVRDLSDRERLTNELVQAQKMEAIGSLVSGVAHELNNPLAAIIAFSQLLRGDPRLPEDMKHDAGLLVQEADRTRRIVQGLLDFARQRPPERRRTSIATLVRSVLELQSYALSTNRVQVVEDIPDDLPEVDLDRAQMQQVLLNLTINAIQAIRSRDLSGPAHLWITAALVKPERPFSRSAAERLGRERPRVRITIRDDGPGVPEETRSRLFIPFFTTKQPGEGTGLGLSVSFGIVAAHGGTLWYEPGPGNVGSSFIVELPVHARPAKEAQDAAAAGPLDEATTVADAGAPRPRPVRVAHRRLPATRETAAATGVDAGPDIPAGVGGAAASTRDQAAAGLSPADGASAVGALEPAPVARPRILALDDEGSIRTFLKKVLALAGMDCDPYQDGAQALEALRVVVYDAMLIDHRMAGMNGTEFYEAAARLRPELADRAVFMSGDVLNPDLRGFATERGIRLLAKPFDIEAVTRVVREAISETGRSGASRSGASDT
jgi:PAS domain S-box-containing protein